MRAMILAAGRGQRMRPLTDTTPKPLLNAGGKPLIVWHIERLARAGITDIVINHSWLGERITAGLGDGARFGARIRYSAEPHPLETAGGIANAIGLLGGQPFLVMNGDIWCDWDPGLASAAARELDRREKQAWLLLAANPAHHLQGDFCLSADGHARMPSPQGGAPTLTFTGIGIYRPALFQDVPRGQPAPLAPLLRRAMDAGEVIATRFAGCWMDIGTPERLHALDRRIRGQAGGQD